VHLSIWQFLGWTLFGTSYSRTFIPNVRISHTLARHTRTPSRYSQGDRVFLYCTERVVVGAQPPAIQPDAEVSEEQGANNRANDRASDPGFAFLFLFAVIRFCSA
jgi:hypothetical protein